jgi:Tfp pilus assembly protein PilF
MSRRSLQSAPHAGFCEGAVLAPKWNQSSLRMPNLSRLQQQAYDCFERGDTDRTERLCAEILGYRPADFEALQLLGLVKLECHRPGEALQFLSAALKSNPASADVLSNLGLALQASGRYDEAIASHLDALRLAVGHPEYLYNLGNAYLGRGRIADAVASYDDVLKTRADHVGCLVNRGNALLRMNDPAAALASYDAARALMPHHPQILTNRGHALRRLDRPAEALADFKAAMAAAPEFAEARFEAAMAHLTLGDFATGWSGYEWRWKTGAFARRRRAFRSGPWLGDQPVAGKTILLHAEQGFGDTIQFIRYAPLLARAGAKVICEVQPELVSLLSGLEGIEVIASGAPLPAFDLHCPLLSLPLAFGTLPETIPNATPYLTVAASRRDHWSGRLGDRGPRVGFVWSGSPAHKNDGNRSMPLARLAGLFENPQVRCFSLQCEMRATDAEVLCGLPTLHHLGDELRDFSDTAALVSLLDVVVAVDTAVAHLAGALGKRVVILLPHAADFRWMRGRDDTPWYPTATLLRQPAFGDWDSVIARLREEVPRMARASAVARAKADESR